MTRTPPQALDAEQSVLGSCLLDPEALETCSVILAPEAFYKESHRVIFRHMLKLYNQGDPVDLVALTDSLRVAGKLEDVGGPLYLFGLADSVPTSAYAETYAGIVAAKAQLRDVISVASQAMQSAYDEADDPAQIINSFQDKLVQLATQGQTRGFYSTLELSNRFVDNLELRKTTPEANALPTGFKAIDALMTGFKRGKLYVLAARPAMGKSALALAMGANVARRGNGVALFSLEMDADEVFERLVSSESKVSASLIAQPAKLNASEEGRLTTQLGNLRNYKIFINDDVTLNVDQMKAALRKLMAREHIGLVILDYTQLLKGNARGNRQEEVAEISRSLKTMARELDVPVLILSQLSRAVESRPNKRPMLSDLRESGALEQDADVVMFIYRDEYYDSQTHTPGIAEIIFAKQRGGPTGTAELTFVDKHVRFEEIERRHNVNAN